MSRHSHENYYPGFLFGLVTGAVGTGLAMYFAPKIGSEIRKRVAASAKDLGDTASDYYEDASTRVADAVEDLTSRGQKVRAAAAVVVARGAHTVARSAHEVARGAHEVERFADKNEGQTLSESPRPRKPRGTDLAFDARSHLFRVTGVDLTRLAALRHTPPSKSSPRLASI